MGLTLDVKSAIGDFNRYEKTTQARFIATLDKFAQLIEGSQKAILRKRVKKWTGRLASTISVTKGGLLYRLIGPDVARAVYAWWIESGGRWGFTGYQYVEGSVKRYKRHFIRQLKKDIERR